MFAYSTFQAAPDAFCRCKCSPLPCNSFYTVVNSISVLVFPTFFPSFSSSSSSSLRLVPLDNGWSGIKQKLGHTHFIQALKIYKTHSHIQNNKSYVQRDARFFFNQDTRFKRTKKTSPHEMAWIIFIRVEVWTRVFLRF